MDVSAASDRSWDHPWTTDEMREKRADWSLAGDSGLLQHLQQFSDKLATTAEKTQEALNSLSSELDETIIFIDNITNTSLALANTQFIESRVCEDEVEAELPQEQEPEAPKTKAQLDSELIASIGESVRRGIAIMEEKYETLEVVASDSEDEGEIPIPRFDDPHLYELRGFFAKMRYVVKMFDKDWIKTVILRPKDPYQDRPLPYIIGSEKWKYSSKIGLETSSSESELQEDDDSESDADDHMVPLSKPRNLENPTIARLSSSSSESNDYNRTNNIARNADDSGSNKNQDIFDSESETTTAANSLPKNSTNTAPSFAEELAKRLGSVIPTQKSINTQVIGEPVAIQPKDDLFTPEDDDLFSSASKNLFSEPTRLFDEGSSSSLWHDKPAKPFKSTVIPSSLDGPPPINDISTKPKSAIDDLFGDADSEDSDDIFSAKTSTSKPLNQNNSPSNLRVEDKKRSNNLLSVGGLIGKEGMMTSTPQTNDISNSLFDDESEDGNLFSQKRKPDDWTGAKTSISEKTAGSTPAESSATNNRKKLIGGVSILGNIDIFASGKLRRQASSDSSVSKSSSDFDNSTSRITNTRDATNSVINNSADGDSVLVARNMESTESSGISLQPPSIDDVTTGSNISPDFQPQMTSTWNKTGDMYRERIGSDSLFASKTLDRDDENSLNNARIDEAPEIQNSRDPFEETDEIFGPPPLPKTVSKMSGKSKITSLFDDSDSGDDLFSNTSSGSRSQKSTDFLATTTATTATSASTSQSSEKSKILRKQGLFDDDDENDDESDIFGTKDSSEVDLFAVKNSAKNENAQIIQEAFTSSIKDETSTEVNTAVQENFENNFTKENTTKISQPTPSTKLGSIFDDLDDDDLFSPSFKKKASSGQKPVAPSLFDDDGVEDLFAVPAKTAAESKPEKASESSSFKKSEDLKESVRIKSATKIGGEKKSEVMEQLTAKLEVGKTEKKGGEESKNRIESASVVEKDVKTVKSHEENVATSKGNKNDIFSHNKSKNLAAKILNEIKIVQKSKMEGEVKPGIPKKPEGFKKLDGKYEVVNKSDIRKDISVSSNTTEIKSESITEETHVVSEESSVKSFESESRISSSEEEKSPKISKSENIKTEKEVSSALSKYEESSIPTKREPPKTLEIRSSTTSVTSEKSSAVQRRVVSGKIKNLMGRMSDLKILSPTDTPPVWRKNEDRVDEEGDKDSEDGSGFSTSKESPTFAEELPKIVALISPTESKELEPAISFDQPVQVETLSVTASKSRVRIQSKRRPQSRRARQNALRKSGIDFDTPDFSNDNNSDTNRNLSSNSANNNPNSTENSANAQNIANSNTDRLIIPTGVSESVSVTVTESSSSTFFDDRSEISFSKESSLSINKNTLLSPSTDEEDLFDVPPDLPEDPPKEDALFGRAPILSPVESFEKVEKMAKTESKKSEKRKDNVTDETNGSHSKAKSLTIRKTQTSTKEEVLEKNISARDEGVGSSGLAKQKTPEKRETIDDKVIKKEDKSLDKSQDQATSGLESKRNDRAVSGEKETADEELNDPLRDTSHDSIKDPSNLFAFVTKTPSPEKGKNLLFSEDDDSLFSSSLSKSSKHVKAEEPGNEKKNLPVKKQTLDLFADEPEVDFFATSLLSKSARKSNRESKIDLFGDGDNQDDDLFGGNKNKSLTKTEIKSSQSIVNEETINEVVSSARKQSLFAESSDEKLFQSSETTRGVKAKATSSSIFSSDDSSDIFITGKQKPSEISSTANNEVKDIFGDQSSGEEDMFAVKKSVIKKLTVSSGLFGDDDDDDGGDIFGKSATSSVVKSKSVETRGVFKKAATRDLRKTAEQIVEDPLSMLQRD